MQDVFQSLSLSLYFSLSLLLSVSMCVQHFQHASSVAVVNPESFVWFSQSLRRCCCCWSCWLAIYFCGILHALTAVPSPASYLPSLCLFLNVICCLFLFSFSLHVLDRDLPKSLWHNTSKATCCRLSLSLFLSFYFCFPPHATPPSNKSELSVKTFEMISLTNRMRKLAPASASVTQLGVGVGV